MKKKNHDALIKYIKKTLSKYKHQKNMYLVFPNEVYAFMAEEFNKPDGFSLLRKTRKSKNQQ